MGCTNVYARGGGPCLSTWGCPGVHAFLFRQSNSCPLGWRGCTGIIAAPNLTSVWMWVHSHKRRQRKLRDMHPDPYGCQIVSSGCARAVVTSQLTTMRLPSPGMHRTPVYLCVGKHSLAGARCISILFLQFYFCTISLWEVSVVKPQWISVAGEVDVGVRENQCCRVQSSGKKGHKSVRGAF